MGKPTSVKDVDQHEVVRVIAAHLKKGGRVQMPGYSDVVKLGKNKELAPIDPDWFYVRTASIARRLYIRAPAGLGAFRKVYGGKKRRGVTPNHFSLASGSVIRKALQSLEGINWVEKAPKGGRRLSKQGRMELDRIASQMRNGEKQEKRNE